MTHDDEAKRLVEQAWREAHAASEARAEHLDTVVLYLLLMLTETEEKLLPLLTPATLDQAHHVVRASHSAIRFAAGLLCGHQTFARAALTIHGVNDATVDDLTKTTERHFSAFVASLPPRK